MEDTRPAQDADESGHDPPQEGGIVLPIRVVIEIVANCCRRFYPQPRLCGQEVSAGSSGSDSGMDATEVWRAQPLDGIFEIRHVGAGAYSLRAAQFHGLRGKRGRGVAEDQPS